MEAFIPMIRNVLVFIALAIPGYLLVKCKLLNESQTGIISKLLMYLGMPFLTLSSTLNVKFSGDLVVNILIAIVLYLVALISLYFLSIVFVKKEKQEKTRAMMRFSMLFSNNGFLGIPLALAVFGQSDILTYVIMLNIINNIVMYTLGVYIVSGDKKTMNIKKAFLNPVLISFIIAIGLNLLDVKNIVPEVATFSTHFSNIVTPLSMTLLGMKLGGIKISLIFSTIKVYYVSLIKLVFLPFLGVLITYLFNFVLSVGTSMIIAMFIAHAMPTAGLASTFSDKYNSDTESAVVFTLGTTIISILTIPLLYLLLQVII